MRCPDCNNELSPPQYGYNSSDYATILMKCHWRKCMKTWLIVARHENMKNVDELEKAVKKFKEKR